MNIILGVSSIFVGIIKSIDTYFQLGKRSESHRLCSLQFQQINKKIMIELSLKRDQRISAKDMLQIIKTDIKNLQDIAPLIDDEIVKIFKKNYGEPDAVSGKITFNAHTPNLCNGLTEVTVNGDRITNEPDNKNGSGNGGSGGGGDGDNNKRRRRNSRERRRSRGSSPDSFGSKGDDDDYDGRGGGGAGVGGGRSSRNSRNGGAGGGGGGGGGGGDNSNKKNDGNISSASNSSGFMSSVSNFIKGGVNLITGNRSRPPSANSTHKVESQDEYRERRRRNKEDDNSAITQTPTLVLNENIIKQQITNEIVELTDAVSYSGHRIGNSGNKPYIASMSTPTHASSPRHTPMLQINNAIQTGVQVHRPEPQQPHMEQLQQLQNLQQFFNSQQRQTPVPNPVAGGAYLPIPQLIAAASTPRVSTPVVLLSNASNKSNTSNIKGTDNVLAAVSANLVYAGVNTNGSQNITPATSKPASVKSEVEPAVVPHRQFVHNVSIPGYGNVYESGSNNNNGNVIIDILPLTHDNLSMHENSMIQQQEHQQEHQEEPQEFSVNVEIPVTTTELPNKNPILPLVFDEVDPEGMM
jgi:hypothetical protein